MHRIDAGELVLKNEGILGKAAHQSGNGIKYSLTDIDVAYVFSDGFASDPLGLTAFREQLAKSNELEVSCDALCKVALDISASLRKSGLNRREDDRSMLAISSKRSQNKRPRLNAS